MTGKDLKTKLELIGIPLRQVAEVLGISEQNLQNKLSAADIKVSFLCRLSLELHKSIYFFLDGQAFYEEDRAECTHENASSLTASAPPPPMPASDSSVTLRLMDRLDEKDKEIRRLNEKLLATSIALSESRLVEAATTEKNDLTPMTTPDMGLALSATNATSVDVP